MAGKTCQTAKYNKDTEVQVQSGGYHDQPQWQKGLQRPRFAGGLFAAVKSVAE
jgi:hypothetical protein